MKKLFQLFLMLRKNEMALLAGENSNSALNRVNSSFIAIVASGLLGFLGYHFADTLQDFGGGKLLYSTFGLFAGAAVLGFGILTLLKSMYMSSDIEVLITMPFSSSEIAILRVLSYLPTAFMLVIVFLVPVQVGLGIVHPQPISVYLIVALSCILIPLFVTGLIAIAVILVMAFVSAMRNIEGLRYIGAVLGFLLILVYYSVRNTDDVKVEDIVSVSGDIAGRLKYSCPIVGLCQNTLESGSVLWLVIAILLTAVVVVLFLWIAEKFYLKGALNMQNGKTRKALSDEEFTKLCTQKDGIKTLVRKEYRMIRRNPVFFTNNFLYGTLWPVIILIVMKRLVPAIMTQLNTEEGIGWTSMDVLSVVIPMLCGAALFMILIPLMTETLAFSSLSREGKSFFIMKQIPIPYRDQLKAKKIMAHRFAQATTTGYMVILMGVIAFLCKMPFYYIILPVILTAALTAEFINVDMLLGIRSADVSWSDEKTGASKNSGLTILINLLHVLAPIYCFVAAFADAIFHLPKFVNLVALVVLLIVLILAGFVMEKQIYTSGEKKIRRLRF